MITDETRPEEFKKPKQVDTSKIKGWGIDADTKNDPTYPMKKRTDEEQRGYSWERPPQQRMDVEMLHSVERKNTPAVFGTSTPPSGLSGNIRRKAFKYSESSYGRWVPLMLADRVNVLEGIAEDLQRGHIPNFFKEYGWASEWKYNRTNFILKTVAVTAVAATVIALMMSSDKKKTRKQAY
jgi:hypothetical protein